MDYKDVYTQEELDEALENGFIPHCVGSDYFVITGNAQIRAYDSAQVTATDSAHVIAHDNAHVIAYNDTQIIAYGNAQVTATGNVHVIAHDHAHVIAHDHAQVIAYDHAQVIATDSAQIIVYDNTQVIATGNTQIKAYDRAQVRTHGGAQITATHYVTVKIQPEFTSRVTGGIQIAIPPIKTAIEWCEYYDIPVADSIVVLYKAVDGDYSTNKAREVGITYKPGTTPFAPDWDPKPECGGGLHFSPTPFHAWIFNSKAEHFIACPVKLDEIVVHYPANYPDKVKAPKVCAPCWEVDIDGNKIQQKEG